MWIDLFRAQVDAHPEKIAIVAEGQKVTYAELLRRAEARSQQASAGSLRHIIVLEEPLAVLEEVIGAWLRQRVPTLLHHGFPAAKLTYLQQVLRDAERGGRNGGRGPGEMDSAERPERREGLILTTSATTSMPKLVVLPHENIQMTAAVMGRHFALPGDTQGLIAAPIALFNAMVGGSLASLAQGWTLHLFRPNTPASVVLSHIRSHGVTLINTVTAFFRFFLRYWSGTPFPALRMLSAGGEALAWREIERLQAACPNGDVQINYGATEIGRVSNISTRDPRAREGAVGMPLAHHELHIEPIEGLPYGELLVRSPTAFLGYLQPDGSYSGLTEDGFFRTRDLFSIDAQGCLYFHGRVDGVVKVLGRMVNVREVSRVLGRLPGVADAACRAVPDALTGHALTAQVVAENGVQLDPRELRRACAAELERHEIPGDISVVDRISETELGKRANIAQ